MHRKSEKQVNLTVNLLFCICSKNLKGRESPTRTAQTFTKWLNVCYKYNISTSVSRHPYFKRRVPWYLACPCYLKTANWKNPACKVNLLLTHNVLMKTMRSESSDCMFKRTSLCSWLCSLACWVSLVSGSREYRHFTISFLPASLYLFWVMKTKQDINNCSVTLNTRLHLTLHLTPSVFEQIWSLHWHLYNRSM